MRSYRYILSISLLVLALAYTLWFVFAGFGNHQDPLYWLYKYEHLEGGWMAVGTLLTGGVIVRLFGAQLLPLRLFGWLCTVTAVALPYGCLLTKEQRRENMHWLALTLFLLGYGAFQEFSPGTLSVLLLSALWTTSVNGSLACEVSTPAKTLLPAVLFGLAIAARFPNILALLILIPLWKKRSLWLIPVAAAAAGIVYLLGYWLVTPAAMDVTMTASHDIGAMLGKYWDKSGLLVGMLFVSVAVLALGKLKYTIHHTLYTLHLTPILGLLVGAALVLFLAGTTKPHQWYNIDLTYFLSALCLVIAFGNYKYAISNLQYTIIGAALLVVAPLGTDTAWLKLFPAVLCLLPVAAAHYEQPRKLYLCCVLAVLAVFVMTRMTTNSVGQSDLTKADTFSSVSPYQGIAIREAEQQRMTQYLADFDSLQSTISNIQCPILAVGQDMHLMRAVTGCEAAKYNEFWSNIFDSVYTDKYREVIRAKRPVVFCSYSPQFKTKPEYRDCESALEQMLREEGYIPLDRSKYKYMIYIPGASSR